MNEPLPLVGGVSPSWLFALPRGYEKPLPLVTVRRRKWNLISVDSAVNVTFKLAGVLGDSVCDSQVVRKAVDELNVDDSAKTQICLVSGEQDVLAKLHPAIKGVRGGNPTGTSFVSFNLPAFRSFGKSQGDNAPVGQKAAFAYTTALNTMLAEGSKNNMIVGEASTVFWSEKGSNLEDDFSDYFSEPPKDDPDRNVKKVKELFDSLKNGAYVDPDGEQNFYVLGLSPNSARLAVRFWTKSTVAKTAENIAKFFRDTEIVHGAKQPERLSVFRLLVSVAVQGKTENIPPTFEDPFMRAILEGVPYPETILAAAVRRMRAEQDVTYACAALIKACLNRRNMYSDPQNNNPKTTNNSKEIAVALDYENKEIGYCLGRLFATLEKIQAEANPGINATIRDRFYGAASGTPTTVFPNLMRLKNHHLSKLNQGRQIYFESLLGEILANVQDFPEYLSLVEQGRFAIGYYHQKQFFYTKSEDKQEKNDAKQEDQAEA